MTDNSKRAELSFGSDNGPSAELLQGNVVHEPRHSERSSKRELFLALGALGVVYGDIGTSPLYAGQLSFAAAGGPLPAPAAVLGASSLIFWALIIVVTIKYVMFIMRADNNGEGGVMALATLTHRSRDISRRTKTAIGLVALLGLALFYGDGMLTPAISVLSATELLKVADPSLEGVVMPLALAILIGLFAFQRSGTEQIGKVFGPVMLVWFLVLGVLGFVAILHDPGILAAINPLYGEALFTQAPWTAFVALGAVVLAVTGCEALYADMGHFGRRPIRMAWLGIALPALLLNYFGQGAIVLRDPHNASIAFYALAPSWAHYPLLALSVVATIIASQAVISGVFSITRQAVQLGQLPRMEIRHTSAKEYGQIYVPRINVMLCIGVVLIVLIFRTSDSLAAAYGIAVTGVMVISTMLVGMLALRQWHWNPWIVYSVFGALGLIDLAFLASNVLKLVEGGWLPLGIAAGTFIVMDTWRVGRRAHLHKVGKDSLPIELFLERADRTPTRVAGTAIFLNARSDLVPGALLHSLKHYRVLHERIVLATVLVSDTPFIPPDHRVEVEKLGKGFFVVKIHYGFFQLPDVPAALADARHFGLAIDPENSTYFLGRETLVSGAHPSIRRWRISLYMALAANALSPAQFYRLPPNRVVELGTQITI